MADTISKAARSKIMSKIRGKNTGPERILRKELARHNIRYRLNYRVAKYRVDIAFPGKQLGVFVDGCFWHGCRVCFRPPKSNLSYWGPKITANKHRDKRVDEAIKKNGWRTIHIWEHELKNSKEKSVKKILKALHAKDS